MEYAYVWLLEVAVLILAAKVLEGLFMRLGSPRLVAYLSIGLALLWLGCVLGLRGVLLLLLSPTLMGSPFEPAIVYIDDRELHLNDMARAFKRLLYIKACDTCRDVSECLSYIDRYIKEALALEEQPVSDK